MRSFYKIFNIIMALCMFGTSISFAAAPSDETIKIASLDGKKAHFVVLRADGTEYAAAVGMNLAVGDTIITDSSGTAELLLADGSVVRIGLNTEYKVEKIQKEGGLVSWAFELVKGSIRGLIEKSPRKDFVKFKVYSPTGTMGVRGTEFIYSYDTKTKQTDLFTMSGTVWLGGKRADFNKPAAFTTVEKGQRSYVRRASGGEFAPAPAKEYQAEDLFKAVPRAQSGDAEGEGADAKLKRAKEEEAQVKEKMALFEKMDKVESTIKESNGRSISVPDAKKILEKSVKEFSGERQRLQQEKSAGAARGATTSEQRRGSGDVGSSAVDRSRPTGAQISGGGDATRSMSTPRGSAQSSSSTQSETATPESSGTIGYRSRTAETVLSSASANEPSVGISPYTSTSIAPPVEAAVATAPTTVMQKTVSGVSGTAAVAEPIAVDSSAVVVGGVSRVGTTQILAPVAVTDSKTTDTTTATTSTTLKTTEQVNLEQSAILLLGGVETKVSTALPSSSTDPTVLVAPTIQKTDSTTYYKSTTTNVSGTTSAR